MRGFFAALAVVALLASCSSSSQPDIPVTIEIGQYDTTADVFLFPGPTNISYQVTVHNDTDQPVTLRRIRLATSGGGAYSLRPTDTPTNIQVAPHASATGNIAVWGYAAGGPLFSHAPVTLRITGYFDGPKGAFLRASTATLEQ